MASQATVCSLEERCASSPKTWGVAAFQLVGDGRNHVDESEQALFLGHAGVEDDLEQQVAQFALQLVQVVALDGVGDLVGFFDRIGGDGGEGLLHVPGAAAVRVAQPLHNAEQAVYRSHRRTAVGSASRASSFSRMALWRAWVSG